jgi:hypothetical protein
MWYIESGDLRGVSGKETLQEAFLDVWDSTVNTSGYPILGVIAAGSQKSFEYESDPDTLFFIPDLLLDKFGRSKKQDSTESVLDAEFIDAPNSREDCWPDVIDG